MSTPRLVWLDPDRADDFRELLAKEHDRVSSVSGPVDFGHIVFDLASYPVLTSSDPRRVSPRYLRHQIDDRPTRLFFDEDREHLNAELVIPGLDGRFPTGLYVEIDFGRLPYELDPDRWDPADGPFLHPDRTDWSALAVQTLQTLVEQINDGFVAIITELDIRRVVNS